MAFPNDMIRWKVELGDIDISDMVSEIETDRRTTDYPLVGTTNAGGATIHIRDGRREFSPAQSNNWFQKNGFDQSGFGVKVEILIGSDIIFRGVIDKVNVSPFYAVLTCLDRLHELATKELTNFGISRDFRLQIDPTGQNLDIDEVRYFDIRTAAGRTARFHRHYPRVPTGRNGTYPFRAGVSPISRDSVTINKSATQTVTIVDEVRDRGVLSSDNVQIADEAVISEGSPIDATSPFPRFQGKSPYRWIEVDDAARKIMQSLGFTNNLIQIPDKKTGLHSVVLARPGYETILGNIGQSIYLTWLGYITDILLDGHFVYFALCVNRDMDYFSHILRYDKRNDSWDDWFTHSVGKRQIFNLAKLGDNIVFTASDARNKSDTNKTPAVGSYDSAVATADRKCLIEYIDTTEATLTARTLVAKNATFPVQLGTYKQFGNSADITTSNIEFLGQNVVADTQRPLLVSGNDLYYYYARLVTDGIEAGLAKTSIGGTATQKFHHRCSNNNQYHGNLAMDSTKIYYTNTFLGQLNSNWRVVESNL